MWTSEGGSGPRGSGGTGRGSCVLKGWGTRQLGAAGSVLSGQGLSGVRGLHLWDSANHLFCSVENGGKEDKVGGRETSLGASSIARVQYDGGFN